MWKTTVDGKETHREFKLKLNQSRDRTHPQDGA